MSSEDEIRTFVGAFPYVMLLSAIFLGGFAFLALVAPVLEGLLRGSTVNDFPSLLTDVIQPRWESAAGAFSDLFDSFVLILASLLTGFCLQKVGATYAMLLAWLANHLGARVFSPGMYTRADYPELITRLQENRALKLEWEWNLFRYWLDWMLATDALFLFASSWALVGSPDAGLLVPLLAWLALSAGALRTSRHMLAIHRYAQAQFGLAGSEARTPAPAKRRTNPKRKKKRR